jgi:hypothetical protein
MEELSRRIDDILTSSEEGLHTRNEEEYNETYRGVDVFETRRTSRRETYRILEYDKRPIEQPYRRVMGPFLDQMIS